MLVVDDDSLLALAAKGDGDAFAAFYRRHADLVLGYLRPRVAEPEQAFDLAAETFAAALVSVRRYRPGRGPAAAWLLGIARHKLLESLRRGRIEAKARRRLGHGRSRSTTRTCWPSSRGPRPGRGRSGNCWRRCRWSSARPSRRACSTNASTRSSRPRPEPARVLVPVGRLRSGGRKGATQRDAICMLIAIDGRGFGSTCGTLEEIERGGARFTIPPRGLAPDFAVKARLRVRGGRTITPRNNYYEAPGTVSIQPPALGAR